MTSHTVMHPPITCAGVRSMVSGAGREGSSNAEDVSRSVSSDTPAGPVPDGDAKQSGRIKEG